MVEHEIYITCENCGREFDHNRKNSLPICNACREDLLNKPISKKATIFLLVIVIFSMVMLYRLPGAMSMAVEYEKGLNALEANMDYSALRSFEKVVDHYPESLAALSSLYEALYETEFVDEAFVVLDKMIALEPEPDEAIADKANNITDKISLYYYPMDEYYELMDTIEGLEFEEQMTLIELYVELNPNDLVASYVLSDYYFELEEYEKIESVLEPLVIQYPDWKMGLYTLIPVKRDLMKPDEARQYYDTLIGMNKENAFSYMIASKAELKFKNDTKALELAEKAYEFAPEDPYVHGTLAMAYHFNSNDEKSIHFLNLFNNSEYVDEATYEFVNLMVNDQSDWR